MSDWTLRCGWEDRESSLREAESIAVVGRDSCEMSVTATIVSSVRSMVSGAARLAGFSPSIL